jgi:LPS export ABC transporter protein LptC
MFVLLLALACTPEASDSKVKVTAQDSLPFMHSVGVSTLISDSGVIRYHLVAEEWDIYTPNSQAPTWKFKKGLLMQRLDEELNVDLYVQADTAYLHKQSMWELRGRVRIRNVQGTKFNTEELYWDLDKHEMWNHSYITIITPERTLEGTEFRSNEEMTRYSVMNSKGDFPMTENETADSASKAVATSSAEASPILPSAASPSLADKTPPIQKLNIKEAELIEATKEKTINLQDKKRKLDVFQ